MLAHKSAKSGDWLENHGIPSSLHTIFQIVSLVTQNNVDIALEEIKPLLRRQHANTMEHVMDVCPLQVTVSHELRNT